MLRSRLRLAGGAVIGLSLTVAPAFAQGIKYDWRNAALSLSYVATEQVRGREVRIPITGDFQLTYVTTGFAIAADIRADLSYMQQALPDIAAQLFNKSEDCGDRIHISGISMSPDGANASLEVSAGYQKWCCTYATLPQVKCHDNWIHVGPIKTLGPPICQTWMQTVQTSKSMLLDQSGNAKVVLVPFVQNGSAIGTHAEVTEAHLDGLAQLFVGLFHIGLRGMAQSALDHSVGGRNLIEVVPSEWQQFVRLEHVNFFDEGNNELGIEARGTFVVTLKSVAMVCERLIWPHAAQDVLHGCFGRMDLPL